MAASIGNLTIKLEVHRAWWLTPTLQALTLLARLGIYSERMTRAIIGRAITVRAK